MKELLKEFGFDRTQVGQVEKVILSVPQEQRGLLLLCLVAGNGEGEGAKVFREYAKDLLR